MPDPWPSGSPGYERRPTGGGGNTAIFDGYIPAAALPELPAAMALTAVIEETGGVKSYWSLRHSAAAPDFHDPACFIAPLTAPENP